MKKSLLAALLLLSMLSGAVVAMDPVNVNTATAMELTKLVNIGPAKAEAIVAYREAHGPFRSLQELTRVTGVGERTVEINLERIILD
jgi:competence protein ComEA